MNNETEMLFAGTDVGVFFRTAADKEWKIFGKGMPVTIISDLKINYTSGKLYAATYGRGFFVCKLPGACKGGKKQNVASKQIWRNDTTLCGDLDINSGGNLTIKATTDMPPHSKLTVNEGATLIVDGGSIVNAAVTIKRGGTLILRNGGSLLNTTGEKFIIEKDAIFQKNDGFVLYSQY